MHVQELARRLGAVADPALKVEIDGVAPMEEAGASQVTFFNNPTYGVALKSTRAGAVLVGKEFKGECPAPLLRVANPYLAFAHAIALFHAPPAPPAGVHPTAILGAGVVLGKDVSIGPYVTLGDRVAVGDGTTIHPHCVVYRDARIGKGCLLHSHAVVREEVRLGDRVILQNGAIVGADGFGFAPRGDGTYEKIPQAGTVELGDDVEVQALSCVDRATIGVTSVGNGTKIDNLVQVGHGSRVGKDTLLCGQVGLAGTTHVGDRVTLAGQVGVAGHLTIGDGATVTAQSGVMDNIPAGELWGGFPAVPFRDYKLAIFYFLKLPELVKRLKALERQVPDSSKERAPSD
jgi:UDP-3-O-[3-hydroxymyristoyl] glucosamine N-acyltransferase